MIRGSRHFDEHEERARRYVVPLAAAVGEILIAGHTCALVELVNPESLDSGRKGPRLCTCDRAARKKCKQSQARMTCTVQRTERTCKASEFRDTLEREAAQSV